MEIVMGTETNVYLGPIIKIKIKNKKIERKESFCSNPSCNEHILKRSTQAKFCPECGSAILRQSYFTDGSYEPFSDHQYDEKLSWYDIFITTKQKNHIIFMPNFFFEPNIPSHFGNERYEETEFGLDNIDMESTIKNYHDLEYVKNLISLLKKDYADDEIMISYSFVQYCS